MRVPPATLGQLTSLPWVAPPSPPTSSASRVTAVRVEASERVTPKPSATSSSTAPAAARVTVLVDAPWRPPLLLMLRCTRCLCSAWRCRGHTCGRAGRWRLPRLSLPLLPQPLLLVLMELLQLLLLLLQLLLLKLRLLLVLMLCCIGSICRTRRRRGRVSCGTGGWRLLLLLLPLMHCCTCRWCLLRRRPSRQRPATAAKDGTTSQPRGRWLVRPRANPPSGRPPPSQSSPNPARSAGDLIEPCSLLYFGSRSAEETAVAPGRKSSSILRMFVRSTARSPPRSLSVCALRPNRHGHSAEMAIRCGLLCFGSRSAEESAVAPGRRSNSLVMRFVKSSARSPSRSLSTPLCKPSESSPQPGRSQSPRPSGRNGNTLQSPVLRLPEC